MTTIAGERRVLESALAVAEGEVTIIKERLKTLRRICEHPNAALRSHQGDPCQHCPDCGGCDV